MKVCFTLPDSHTENPKRQRQEECHIKQSIMELGIDQFCGARHFSGVSADNNVELICSKYTAIPTGREGDSWL
jgi:hypothetical protein